MSNDVMDDSGASDADVNFRGFNESDTSLNQNGGSADHIDDQPATIIRAYSPPFSGPYTVYIRETDTPISPCKFTAYINKNYKSVIQCNRIQNKFRVILSSMMEANALSVDKWFKAYSVYIPGSLVEVVGAINYNDVCDLADMKELQQFGTGHFSNTILKPVSILSAQRISKRSSLANDVYELTNTVKVVFTGRILPSHIIIQSLRIRVRPFFNKAMFCQKCQEFNHTQKFCKKTAKCAYCQGPHLSQDCTGNPMDPKECPYCGTQHIANNNYCPHFIEVNECYKRTQAKKQHDKYLKALSESVPATVPIANLQDPNNFPALSNRFSSLYECEPSTSAAALANFADPPQRPQSASIRAPPPPNPWAQFRQKSVSATKRKREPPTKANESTATVKHPSTVIPSPMSPGFQKSRGYNSTKETIMQQVRNMNFDSKWKGIIEAILPAILDAILPHLTTLLSSFIPVLFSNKS